MIKSDYELTKYADSMAKDIFDEFKDDNADYFDPESLRDEMTERAWEDCDQNENVIYTHRAISICGNCETDAGEEWLSDIYESPFNGCDSFADVCTRLAFAELHSRVVAELETLISEYEPEETEETEE